MQGFHVLVMPTVPVIAPAISDLGIDDDLYHKINLLMLRNPTYINFLDGCALSIPCHFAGDAPVGFMLARFDHEDHKLLAVGEAIEKEMPHQLS
jgi:aspartyl-tRNA(Asn)/glutamyl-tRNA(Gln) amidotransferase subunit A